MSKVYVIMPVYNEATEVGHVIAAIRKRYDHVVCVNDGSRDASAVEIERAGGVLVDHPINLGAGAATQTGIDYALQDPEATYFVTIDADGQHDIADVEHMLGHLRNKNLDVVIGSRFLGEIKNISWFKKRFLKTAAVFSGSISGLALTDPHNGLRVFNRRFAESLKITLPDFTHASEVVDRIREGGYKYDEFPVTVRYTEYSKAKGQPMLNAVNIAFDLLVHRMTKK